MEVMIHVSTYYLIRDSLLEEKIPIIKKNKISYWTCLIRFNLDKKKILKLI